MKISELFSGRTKTIEDIVAEQVAKARKAYPQYADRSDLEAVALLASHLGGLVQDRNELFNLNADQAQKIARLQRLLVETKGKEDET